ncbi:PucR family transcriptional regulator [Planococcus salinus]|uniref:PucR family transcriptional regulator n=1 Tax=Planococcus salinus TaxID=1848460 RepID=A0A3M8P5V5_9BACL|nr:PucR family transcriptional regulator ligand-binding domain-containing protein [Planococcus salinus]RNF39059.1 PucR family transcriptional regulator [Planococcus salinus]
MSLSMEDVLQYEILKNVRVVAGKEFLSDRPVQWVSVIEMPVENFVRKNELVLTTAIGCRHDVEAFRSFVSDVINSEASALMIAVGRHVYDIPKEVIELAEANDFILIEIPWETRFATIIEAVMKDINDIHHKDRTKSEKAQQELLMLILNNSELKTISKYIQRHIGFPIVITDRRGSIQETNGHSHAFIDKWQNYVLEGIVPLSKEQHIASQDPMAQKLRVVDTADHKLLQIPIFQAIGGPQGYIFVILPADISIESYLTVYRMNVLEHAATTISLWLSRQNAIEATKISMRSDFVHELAKGSFTTADEANSRAKMLGYDLQLPYTCIIGYPENFKELFEKRKREYDSFTQWTESMVRYIEEEILYAAKSLKREIMFTYQGENLLIYLEKPPVAEHENKLNFLDLVDRRLRNLLPEVVISWGIGDYVEGFQGLAQSYQHALLALSIGRRKKGKGQRTLYENTRVDRILLTLTKNEEMKDIITSTIEPLVRYDEQRQMDLIGTFIAYNQYHGNVSQTSRALNLHRQSLLYRLRKIESLTGLSLVDPDDLFLLDLSIKTWKIGMSGNAN